MHANQRQKRILELLDDRDFITFDELEAAIDASPTTLRRDLGRMAGEQLLVRVHGGAKRNLDQDQVTPSNDLSFHKNKTINAPQKKAIGKAAAQLCRAGESIILDGGSTTLQLCSHLHDIKLNVWTNSLHIITALFPNDNIQVSVPAGTVFRQQDIILSPFDEDGSSRYHATKFFMGVANISAAGPLQSDAILMQVEQRLIQRADELIVLADASKFNEPTGYSICALEKLHYLITDDGISDAHASMIEQAGVKLIVTSV